MAPGSVVEALDVGKDIALGFSAGGVLPVMHALGLERVEETFHRRVVVAVALAAHRGGDSTDGQSRPIVMGGILHASIGMMDQAGTGPLCRDCLLYTSPS